jgi:formate/nitrite transporter FocA (FNT family)
MYFVPLAILIRDFDPMFITSRGLDAQAAVLGWTRFLWSLVPVTACNLIGGAALVAAVYWFVYLRGRSPA